MTKEGETFWQFLKPISRRPVRASTGTALAQSAAAFGLNLWCLILAVLGQFWVFFSAVLLFIQTYNTWRVAKGRMSIRRALVFGILLVSLNFSALSLAVLGQFWVFASTALAVWQYISLVRVCNARRRSSGASAELEAPSRLKPTPRDGAAHRQGIEQVP